MSPSPHTHEIRLIKDCSQCNFSAIRTGKTLNRKSESMNGSVVITREDLSCLKTGTSIVKGTLAILLFKQASLLIKTSGKTTRAQAYLQILLQDMMDEIWKMEAVITTSENILKAP